MIVPSKPTNGAGRPPPSLMTSSEATSGMPAARAFSITVGPICWSGTTIAIASTLRAMAASTSASALAASVPTSTTVTSTLPSLAASAFAPAAWSTKYCCEPCFCR
jgi:hypothetical protein